MEGSWWGSIVYLAAISGIPQEQYEAAYIEGATRLQRAIYVTIPFNILYHHYIFNPQGWTDN
jgi:ABC-type polysaccharide transport system permease subunit